MKKKIMIIDDSALMRRVISDIIERESDFEIVKIARNGLEGYETIVSNPSIADVIIMDINMPKMNGLEVLERLMKDRIRITVIVVSTLVKEGAAETIRALELGAFDFVTKPETGLIGRDSSFAEQLVDTVRVAASVRRPVSILPGYAAKSSVKREERMASTPRIPSNIPKTETRTRQENTGNTGIRKLVAVACSTGGPKALQSVIPMLPDNLDAPVILVQHMPRGFTASLALRLDELSAIHVKEAQDGDILEKGTVYIAQGGQHMLVSHTGKDYRIVIDDSAPVDALKPSANRMYESLAEFPLQEITCVVLTGMGSDGTRGITSLAKKNKVYVVAQDEESSVVYGMPRAIYDAGIVNEVVPLDRIADAIIRNVGVS